MTTTPTTITANALLDAARQIEADERRLKKKMLACARIREFDRFTEVLEVWLVGSAADALRKLDPCGDPEVSPPVGPQE